MQAKITCIVLEVSDKDKKFNDADQDKGSIFVYLGNRETISISTPVGYASAHAMKFGQKVEIDVDMHTWVKDGTMRKSARIVA